MTTPFGSRLRAAVDAAGPVCVGIDPHPYLLRAWGLADDAVGLREFGVRVVEAAAGRSAVVKPQVAFFERHGSAGYAALEHVLERARSAGLLVIADAKRGDIGTTGEAYGQAWLTPGSPLEADALTVNPYLGLGSLDPVRRLAAQHGKGLFVLAATSNPEAFDTQTSVRTGGGETVAAAIVRGLATDAELGSEGVVIGATVRLADYGIDTDDLVHLPVLAPGFGAQGARIRDLPDLFGSAARNVLVASSRGLLDDGPDGVASAIDAAREEVLSCLA